MMTVIYGEPDRPDDADNPRDVGPFERGELLGRFSLMETKIDYWGKPEESAKKTRGGWVRSGDIVYADDQGWLFFCHRKGAEIRRYGDFIQPDLIARVLIEHPFVDDVTVYGVPSKAGAPGEKDVVAAVVLKDKRLDLEELASWCHARLEKSHIPSYFQVVKEIPKTPSERPLTRLLEEDFAEGKGVIYELERRAYPTQKV
jgi:crotonobetaine/carnitine-CoA ligase